MRESSAARGLAPQGDTVGDTGHERGIRGGRTLSLLAVAVGVASAGCGGSRASLEDPLGEEAQAIQGGYADIPDDAVVGLALMNADGHIYRTCSGSLIAPNLVLTAQHCIATTSKFVRCDDAAFGPPVGADSVIVTTDGQMWSQATRWLQAAEVLTPPGAPAVCGRDEALVILQDLLTIPTLTPRLTEPVGVDEPYSAIGYGATTEGGNDGGVRRRRDSLSVACSSEECNSDHVVGDEWRGDHGICSGDSGGPAIDARGQVIGVTSRGPVGCDDPIYGGVGLLAQWIADGGVQAAQRGGYPAPTWSGGPGGPLRQGASGGGGGCGFTPVATLGGAAGVVLLALAALSLGARRRAGILRRR